MYVDAAALVLSPTDLTKHLAWTQLTALDLRAARHEIDEPAQTDDALDLEHEAGYLRALKDRGLKVVEVPDKDVNGRVSVVDSAVNPGL